MPAKAQHHRNPLTYHSHSSLPVTRGDTAPECPHCSGAMGLVRRLDLKDMPEIYIFYCSPCQHAETVKQERAA
jgi:hypothetical protein